MVKKTPTKPTASPSKNVAPARMSLAEVMAALEAAGSAQTRKTYARHGATEPMFGVSFATLKVLTKRIKIDHELALALWDTGNLDARNLAVKIVEPARLTSAELDRWARDGSARHVSGGYAAMLAAETPHGIAKADKWLGSKDTRLRVAGWTLLAQLAQRDEATPDAFFATRLAEIERTIHAAPSPEREVMNLAVISIGLRSAGLRKTALVTAKRIGKVDVDHGDTACQTSDAAESIHETWAHSTAKGFDSPAAHERSRERPRRPC